MEENLEMENLGTRPGITDGSIITRGQEKEERISGVEHTLEHIDRTVKENSKHKKKLLTQNIQKIQNTMQRPNLSIIGIEESEDSQIKGHKIFFNKIIEEKFPNLKKEMAINVQEAHRTPNKLVQKRKSTLHIIIKTLNE
jgi:hypothetical protein